jgi:hypothetical protein
VAFYWNTPAIKPHWHILETIQHAKLLAPDCNQLLMVAFSLSAKIFDYKLHANNKKDRIKDNREV